jgi:hypothetical protein
MSLVHELQDTFGIAKQGCARGRQLDASPEALEEPCPQSTLQHLNLLADGWLA